MLDHVLARNRKGAHEDVNGQVGNDRNPGNRRASVELSVAEGSSRSVVEDVKEHEGLLLDDEEDRVCELPVCRSANLVSHQISRLSLSVAGDIHLNCPRRKARVSFRSLRKHKEEKSKTHVVVDDVVRLETGSPGVVAADRVEPSVLVDDGDDLRAQQMLG